MVVAVETVVTAKVLTVEVVWTVLVKVAAVKIVVTPSVEMTVVPIVLIVAITETVVTEVTGAAVHAGCDWMHEQAVLMTRLACEVNDESRVALASVEVVDVPVVLLVDEVVAVVLLVDVAVDEVVEVTLLVLGVVLLVEAEVALDLLVAVEVEEDAVVVARLKTSPKSLLILAAGCRSKCQRRPPSNLVNKDFMHLP